MRAHADDLRAEVDDEKLIDSIASDWETAPLDGVSARAAALCRHAGKLTLQPAAITPADVNALRAAGCTDKVIADLTQVVALFAYFNRLADGLGIDPEPEWE